MTSNAGFFNFSINKILHSGQSALDAARVRLLYYGLALSFFTSLLLFFEVLYKEHFIISIIIGSLTLISAILFKYLTYRPRYRVISHIILVVATLANIVNIYIAKQNADAVTVGVIILITLFSFNMLGQKAGFVYSALNIVPTLALLILQHNNSFLITLKPEKIDDATFIISLSSCLMLILFVYSHFYAAFNRAIYELSQTGTMRDQITADFEQAIEKANKSSEAKSEFLSTMSHEIRTPLNAVIGMTDLLMMGGPRPDQKENLEVLKFSAGNLLSIVNDVLDFNKIESGKLIFEKIRLNLHELMNNICGGLAITARQKGLNFTLNVDKALQDKALFGDPTRITQIVFNLVNNAIKFTTQGDILVKVKCIEDRHDRLTVNFKVKDSGIGIQQNRLDVIFEPFTQESVSTTRQYGGTGLGLAIVKRLLELQGIKINVNSTVNEGSEFSFNMEFPVATEKFIPASNKVVVEQQNEGNNFASLRVLIAEDNPVNVMLMKKLLSKWNITPFIAENGERAVEFVQYGNFDVILMDLQMPVMNGFDAAVEIRKMADPQKSNIPIIALTASALFDIKERVYNSGMNDYVSKPFKPTELFEKIQNLVNLAPDAKYPHIPVNQQ
ncbi:ATP-binding protein [Mucilaginibacter auburnensis]|uniref:histidine kinase n=1 Tax=Mucilaginibacter auburnensis TaxID=1457233 RepID=A0A2H9VMX5_9SPHI|nr:ATP-binding protein [Mucilaginibacter auburnensis]PJJ79681.1 signal transduction histidine kinase [Mucilaginibacter auburnensis]